MWRPNRSGQVDNTCVCGLAQYDAAPLSYRRQEYRAINTAAFSISHADTVNDVVELPETSIRFPNPHTAVIRRKQGCTVDMAMVANTQEAIAQRLKGDYGMIIDRQEDYSLLPVPVFQFLNAWVPLRVIAIVAHREMSKTVAQIDQCLSKKPLAIFDSIDDAQAWVDQQLHNQSE